MSKPKAPARSPNYRAPALEKGLDILELIAGETKPLNLSEISDRVRRSKGEIFRMIMALESRGYILRADNGEGYLISNRLFKLGMAQPPVRSLLDVALPRMQKVAEKIWQSCHLAVASDDEIVVIARVNAPGDFSYSVQIGHKRPIEHSASGTVLFAFQPEEVRENWLKELKKKRKLDQTDFLARVRRARTDGHITMRSKRVDSVTDISAPLFDGERAVAAITIPFIKQTPLVASTEQSVAELRRAAHDISSALGLNTSPVVLPGTLRPHRK